MNIQAIYFIEVDDPGLDLTKAVAVALNPSAAGQLASRRIKYYNCEDFLPVESILSLEEVCPGLFQQWVNLLDEQIAPYFSNFKAYSIGPAKLYGYYLQLLVDSFILPARQIMSILAAYSPSEVVFVGYKQKEQPVDYQLAIKGCSPYLVVLRYISVLRKIRYRQILVKSPPGLTVQKKVVRGMINLARRTYFLLQGLADRSQPKPKRPAIMVLLNNWGISQIALDFKKKGYRCIRLVSKPLWKINNNLRSLSLGDLNLHLGLFDAVAAIPLSGLLEGRLRYFIEVICPNLNNAVAHYADYLVLNQIKYVFTPYKSSFDDFAIMAAATVAKNTIAVQVMHGYSALGAFFWKFSEQPCNLYLTYDSEISGYFSDVIFKETSTPIALSHSWTKRYLDFKARRNGKVPKGNAVLYIPTMIGNPWYRFDSFGYPDNWYALYQRALLKFFASQKQLRFTYKAFPSENQSSEFMKNSVINGGWDNITYSNDDLWKCLNHADYAIIDIPTTPLYETVAAGIPACCLYHRSFRVRPQAKKFYGDILQPFTTYDEAIACVLRFLNSNPENYVKNVSFCPTRPIDAIENYKFIHQQDPLK